MVTFAFVAALAAATSAPGSAPTVSTCAERLLPPSPVAAAGKRAPVAQDLVELRDFGRVDSGAAGLEPFSVSPDAQWAALVLRRADASRDSYCLGLVLVDLKGEQPARLLDTGGDLILYTHDNRGTIDVTNGAPRSLAPLWAEDSRTLYFLRRDDGVTRVWRVGLDGIAARPLTPAGQDIRDLRWGSDGRLRATVRPGLAEAAASVAQEGRTGYRYDRRFWPLADAAPRAPGPMPLATIAIDPVDGTETPDSSPPSGMSSVKLEARQADARAWIEADPAVFLAPARLRVTIGGREVACGADACGSRVVALWWRNQGELLFLRSAGPDNGGRTDIYSWRPARDAMPRLLFATIDALMNCGLHDLELICAHETAQQPRTLVRLDPDRGRIVTLFDPNPELRGIRMSPAHRLVWRDADGVPSYGDLVLPPDHRPGERHPLVVVQYSSQGFLRGGTGDEYPIQLLAANGIAVLSVQRPGSPSDGRGARDAMAAQAINVRNWAERRRLVSGVHAGIDAAIARGVVDPQRVGITGLSDGADTVQFALVNSTRFRAAAVSSCCEEPGSVANAGLGFADDVRLWGYPPPWTDIEPFWKPMSYARNADHIRTPLLMQLADREYRSALESYEALDRAGAPVEMYVFPDEFHIKWHPLHRLAIYERVAAWFSFWLLDRPAPAYPSWEKMRAAQATR